MRDMNNDLDGLIHAARTSDEPLPGDRERLRAALSARLGIALASAGAGAAAATLATTEAAAATVATTAGATTATTAMASTASVATAATGAGAGATVASAGLFGTLTAKALVAVAVLGAAGAGTVLTLRTPPARTVHGAIAPSAAPRTSVRTPALAPAPRANVTAPGASEAPAPAPASARAPAPVQAPAPRAARTVTPALAPAPAIADEIALIRSVQHALRDARTEEALALLDAHRQRFPRGALREEASAARAIALCTLGREAPARAAVRAFNSGYPGSAHTARVQGACGDGVR